MSATALAEAATLGTLMLRREALTSVDPWLRAHDFLDPWNQQVYRTIREQQVAHAEINPHNVGLSLLERVGPHKADLVRVAGLIRLAPQRGDACAYGRMVLEASLRREVALQGVLLRACALTSALTHEARSVVVGVDMVDQALREGERRWQLASGEPSSPSTAHPELAPALRNPDRFLASDRLLSAHPKASADDVHGAERQTVAALICHPDQLGEVRSWLRPEWITAPEWRSAYEALLVVADSGGAPIDAVTVSWECRRASAGSGPGPAPLELLQAVAASISTDPGFCARRVAAHVVRRTADSSARLLDAAANNPGLDLAEVYTTAHVATAALRTAAAPLTGPGSGQRNLQLVPAVERAQERVGPVAG